MNVFQLQPQQNFSIILAIGIAVGIYWSSDFIFPPKRDHAQQRLNIIILVLLGALFGGRIAYVIINWVYFKGNLVEAIQFWLGGESWFGALSGGLVLSIIAAKMYNQNFLKIIDGLLPLFCSISISIWMGSWLFGNVYGYETDAWWAFPARDEWGVLAYRFPVPLLGAVSTLAVHAVVEFLQQSQKLTRPGIAACLEFSGFSLIILILSQFRADPTTYFLGLRFDAWGAVILLSCMVFLTLFIVSKPDMESTLKSKTEQP